MRQGCLLRPLLFNTLFATIPLYSLERFSEDADILASLAYFQEQPSIFCPETAPLECARSAIWGMLYTDDVCFVSRSSRRGLERMVEVLVKVFGVFCLLISESKTGAIYMPIPRAPATQIVLHTLRGNSTT